MESYKNEYRNNDITATYEPCVCIHPDDCAKEDNCKAFNNFKEFGIF